MSNVNVNVNVKVIYTIQFILIMHLEKPSEFPYDRSRSRTAGPDSSKFHQWTLCKNTADGTDFVNSDSASTPEFILELLPTAQRTALLYRMAYLCLGTDPELERLIRKQAVETQLLFGSSEAFLLKCVGTSDNLVTSLLPSLKVAAEKNKPHLALKFLEKAKDWIGDIIIDVKDIVKKYHEHNSDVAALTSDIISETNETKEKLQQQTSEMEDLQKIIDGLEADLLYIGKVKEDYKKKIDKSKSEIDKCISRRKEESTFSSFWKTITFNTEESKIMALHVDLSEITEAQNRLKEQEWSFQNELMDHQLKLDKLKIKNGQMASVTHLDKVQKGLSQIQQILVQLQKFCEKVGSLLDILKKKTFAGEDWIDDLADMKEEFLESIDAAQEEWTKFGINSMKAYKIFSVQANQAYRFLEISPSSLSIEERQKELDSVKDELENIRPNTVSPAAIMQ